MSLDLSKLAKVKRRAGKIIAQCPVCAESGADKSGEHFVAYENGKWGCVAFTGDKDHRREIAAMIGDTSQLRTLKPLPVRRVEIEIRRKLELPPLRVPTVGELALLAELRALPFFAGCELAVRAGMLSCAELPDAGDTVTAWVLLDSSHRCAQARRLDGKPWRTIGAKAKTLAGSQAAWPIGVADICAKPFVALCEGGPDTLAAWSLAWWEHKADEIAPVCMAGSHAIHFEALPYFAGKGVWLFPHRDEAGQRAREKWTAQLMGARALWVKPFDVAPYKDLNEWLSATVAKEDEP